MGSFRGLHSASLDQKGRLNLPSRFRKQINPESDGRVVLIKGNLPCIYVYPADVFEQFEKEILEKRKDAPAFMSISRKLNASLDEQAIDKQGRVMISSRLLESAGLKKDVLVLGNFTHMEIWDPDQFEKYEEETSSDSEILASHFGM